MAPTPGRQLEPRGAPPTFSVLIAAYQAADVVGDAIESALAQTEPPLEVVVCDDGSTDGTGDVLESFGARITVIRQENGGEASAKNAAARVATAEFVAILDADDVYLPRRLAALARLATERPDLDILTTDAFLEVDGRTVRRVYTDAWRFAAEAQRMAILERNFIFGHVAVRRELLLAAGGFDESIRRTTDWECWIRLLLDGAVAGAVMEPLSRYRVRAGSLSADRAGMLEGGVQTLRKGLAHPGIRADERAVGLRTLADFERRLAVTRLRDSLRQGRPDARRRAAEVARARSMSLPTRAKAAAAWLAPRPVGGLLRRRRGRGWVGAGGTRVDA